MKLRDYNLLHWKKNDIAKTLTIETFKILLLNIDMTLMPPKEGRKNLIAIDINDEIIWVAELPKLPYTSYSDAKIIEGRLYGWADSTLCEIDIKTGKVLTEEFVR